MPSYSGKQIQAAVEALFQVVRERSSGDELVFCCPCCGDASGNRSVNLKSGLTNCWRCGGGGRFDRWLARNGHDSQVLGEPFPQAVEIDDLGLMMKDLESVGEKMRPSGYVPSVELPQGFIRLEDEPGCAYARLIGKMAARKHLELEDLIKAGVGFTRTSFPWEPYAIFPVLEWRRPVYYQGRTYTDKPGQPTKLFPSREVCPLGSRHWVYNIDEVAATGGVVILVEAILNVLSLKKELLRRNLTGVVPVAVFKHKLSPEQRTKLLAAGRRSKLTGHPVTEYCVMYDGRTEREVQARVTGMGITSARADAKLLLDAGRVSVVELPDRMDPNDDVRAAVDLFMARVPYDDTVDFDLPP